MKMVKIVSIKEAYRLWAKRYEKDLPYLFEMESEKIIQLLGNLKGKNILDLGCGTGRYSILLAKKGANVFAVDFSKEMLTEAKKKARNAKIRITFKQYDLKRRLNLKEKFDVIISTLVIGHFRNPNLFFSRISHMLKPNGICLISTFHPAKAGAPSGKFILVQSLGLSAKTYNHSIKECLTAMKKAGLSLEKFLELKFPRKIILKAKREGVNLEPYSHSPFIMVFKCRKRG